MAAPPNTNFGSKGALATYDSSAAFRFEVPKRVCGKSCRSFKSAALARGQEIHQAAIQKSEPGQTDEQVAEEIELLFVDPIMQHLAGIDPERDRRHQGCRQPERLRVMDGDGDVDGELDRVADGEQGHGGPGIYRFGQAPR